MPKLGPGRLVLTEEEAYVLLSLCMTSATDLNTEAEDVLKKLANFCKSKEKGNHSLPAEYVLEKVG